MLNLDDDPTARTAVTIEPVEHHDTSRSWTEDQVTIDWARLTDTRRSSTGIRLAAFARSMLDGTAVDMREIVHFGHGTYAHFMHALAVAWPEPPPSIEELAYGSVTVSARTAGSPAYCSASVATMSVRRTSSQAATLKTSTVPVISTVSPAPRPAGSAGATTSSGFSPGACPRR